MGNEIVNRQMEQGDNFFLLYNVPSYPVSHVQWWRSKDGVHYESIGKCPPDWCKERCEKKFGKVNISDISFEIKDLKYPEDEYFYKCNASNAYGNDSKEFKLKIYGNYNLFRHLYMHEFII